jgi:hypothetical protein
MYIDSWKPTGNCTDDELLSLSIARPKDMMRGTGLDYTKKDTPHSEWVFHLAYKVLKKSPKWQGVDGPVMDLESGSLGLSGVAASRNELQMAADDEGYTGPPGRKKAKRARKTRRPYPVPCLRWPNRWPCRRRALVRTRRRRALVRTRRRRPVLLT